MIDARNHLFKVIIWQFLFMDFEQAKGVNDNVMKLVASARIEKGLSQYRLAELTGLSRQAIRMFEKGEINPTFISLLLLITALELDLPELVEKSISD